MLRIYLPIAADQLARLRADRRLTGPVTASMVTPAVRSADPNADLDTWEWQAMLGALTLVPDPLAVVVIAADVPSAQIAEVTIPSPATHTVESDTQPWPGVVQVSGEVPLDAIASLHLPDREDPNGSLLWYDLTELDEVSALLGGREQHSR